MDDHFNDNDILSLNEGDIIDAVALTDTSHVQNEFASTENLNEQTYEFAQNV